MVLTFLAECQQYCNYEKLPPIAKYIVKVMKKLPKNWHPNLTVVLSSEKKVFGIVKKH